MRERVPGLHALSPHAPFPSMVLHVPERAGGRSPVLVVVGCLIFTV